MWTGWVGNDGAGGGPVITNAEAGYDWSTYPERLERAGVSWKVYQDIGVGLTAEGFWGWTGDQPYIGNYGDNALLYFHQYQNALPGNPLADKAKVGTNIANQGTLFDIFRADVESGNLPQVSWIVAPEALTEHPNWAPDFGAWYVSQFVDILSSNADVFSKTVLFVNYDEEGGFFDHVVPPTPAASPELGASTVDIVNEIYPGDPNHPSGPYGLGMRVPMIVVSPWSKGGWVNSQVFDHTSLIQFIEARFAGSNTDLIESNITPWRRAVTGDLTSAFNFKTPNAKRPSLPNTDGFQPTNTDFYPDLDVVPPTMQAVPRQERGVKLARPLPYTLEAHATVDAAAGSVEISFVNSGSQTAVFHVHSANLDDVPRTYTVEPGKQLSGDWVEPVEYGLEVRAPNGFFRSFEGNVAGPANLDVRASYRSHGNEIALAITNLASARANVVIVDKYTGRRTERKVDAGETERRQWSLERTNGWYDLIVTVEGDSRFERRIAGHVETGKNSTTDPGMGGLVVHA
jgi:phospholipase C